MLPYLRMTYPWSCRVINSDVHEVTCIRVGRPGGGFLSDWVRLR
jgi:hypothetical protein